MKSQGANGTKLGDLEPAPVSLRQVSSPALVRCRDAAHFLGISEWSIREMAHNGELPYIQRAGHSSPMLFDVADLRKWIERQKVHGGNRG